MNAPPSEPRFALRATSLKKRFKTGRTFVEVLKGVDFEALHGEVTMVMGPSGSGKSTLVAALSGRLRPDSGQVWLDGRMISFGNPLAAKRAGISIIAQELELVPTLSIIENIFLGAEPTKFGIIRWREGRKRVAAVLKELGIDAEPGRVMALS